MIWHPTSSALMERINRWNILQAAIFKLLMTTYGSFLTMTGCKSVNLIIYGPNSKTLNSKRWNRMCRFLFYYNLICTLIIKSFCMLEVHKHVVIFRCLKFSFHSRSVSFLLAICCSHTVACLNNHIYICRLSFSKQRFECFSIFPLL